MLLQVIIPGKRGMKDFQNVQKPHGALMKTIEETIRAKVTTCTVRNTSAVKEVSSLWNVQFNIANDKKKSEGR